MGQVLRSALLEAVILPHRGRVNPLEGKSAQRIDLPRLSEPIDERRHASAQGREVFLRRGPDGPIVDPGIAVDDGVAGSAGIVVARQPARQGGDGRRGDPGTAPGAL